MNKEVRMPAPPQQGTAYDGNENTAQRGHHHGTERCALHPQDESKRFVCINQHEVC